MVTILYGIAFFSFLIGIGAVLTLIEWFPIAPIYYHARFRKHVMWSIFLGCISWVAFDYYTTLDTLAFKADTIIPLCIISLALLMTYKVHQDVWFQADNFPQMVTEPDEFQKLPIKEDASIAIIEVNGITKAYPLGYVIHHHIVNDQFGDKLVALTYCAMCRSIMPFDVTDLGTLFVGSFKSANMIVADRRTKTFFQQATMKSIIGKLHPSELKLIPFQILSWQETKKLNPLPQVAHVIEKDFRAFRLPMPHVWKKVMTTDLTPGLSSKDTTYPSKTQVIGVIDSQVSETVAYLKEEVIANTLVINAKLGFSLVTSGEEKDSSTASRAVSGINVNGFKNSVNNKEPNFVINEDGNLQDKDSGTIWNTRGKHLSGSIKENLTPISITDEYWFSWAKWHGKESLIKLNKN